MKKLLISDKTAEKIKNQKRCYMDGLIPENEFYNKLIDSLIQEFYMIKLPDIED